MPFSLLLNCTIVAMSWLYLHLSPRVHMPLVKSKQICGSVGPRCSPPQAPPALPGPAVSSVSCSAAVSGRLEVWLLATLLLDALEAAPLAAAGKKPAGGQAARRLQ